MEGKTIGGIVLAVLIAVGVFISRGQRESKDGEDVLEASRALISACPLYAKNTDYFEYLLTQAHETAFEEAYTIGGSRRRTHVEFDAEKYHTLLFKGMIDLAIEENAKHIADQLAVLRQAGPGAFANPKGGPAGGR